MDTKKLQVEVPANIAAFADSAGLFAKSIKVALKDGFQVGQDVPVIITSAIQNLLPALQNLKGATSDLKADPYGAARAIALAMVQVAEDFLSKSDKPLLTASADAPAVGQTGGNGHSSVTPEIMSASPGGLV